MSNSQGFIGKIYDWGIYIYDDINRNMIVFYKSEIEDIKIIEVITHHDTDYNIYDTLQTEFILPKYPLYKIKEQVLKHIKKDRDRKYVQFWIDKENHETCFILIYNVIDLIDDKEYKIKITHENDKIIISESISGEELKTDNYMQKTFAYIYFKQIDSLFDIFVGILAKRKAIFLFLLFILMTGFLLVVALSSKMKKTEK